MLTSRDGKKSELSILLASDTPGRCHGLRKLLDANSVQVVAHVENGDNVVPIASTYRPHLALLDVHMKMDALSELVRELCRHNVAVLLMTETAHESEMTGLFLLGLSGMISRDATPELLLKSIQTVCSGQLWMSRTIFSELMRRAQRDQGTWDVHAASREMLAADSDTADSNSPGCEANRFRLTPRELQIVQSIGGGMTNKSIAIDLGISEFTVKHHLSRIFDKLGVFNRLELAVFAKHRGLIETRSAETAIVS